MAEKNEWEYTGPTSLEIACTKEVRLTPNDPNPLSTFTVVEPEVGHMSAFQAELVKSSNEFEAGAVLISKNSGITLAQARKLSVRDFTKALDFLQGFTPPLPKDGES